MRISGLILAGPLACLPAKDRAAAAFGDDLAPAALRLCLAMQIERLDDGLTAAERIADAALLACAEEIEALAGALEGAAGDHLRAEVRRGVADLVQAFRAESGV